MKKIPNIVLTMLLGFMPVLCGAEGLLQVYQHAKGNNPGLRVAAAKKGASVARKEQAEGTLLPQLGLVADYSLADNEASYQGSRDKIKSYPRTRSVGINLKQSIIDFEKWREVSLHKGSEGIEVLSYQAEQQKLLLYTVEAYLNVLRSVEEIKKINSRKIALGKAVGQMKQRFQLGMDPISELYSAQSNYDLAVAELIKSQSDLENKMDSLAVITGYRYKEINMLGVEQFSYQPPMQVDVALKESGQGNLELAKARLEQNLAIERVRAAKAKHLPTVNLTAVASIRKVDNNRINNKQENDKDIRGSLTLEIPLFSGGQTSSVVKQNSLALEQVKAQLEAQHRQTVQNVRTNHNNALTNLSVLHAAKRALTSAQMSLEATEAGFDSGTKTIVDVLHSRYSLEEAKTALFNSRYDYLLNSLKLKYETGQLNEHDIIEMDKRFSRQTVLSAVTEDQENVSKKRVKAPEKKVSPKQVGIKSNTGRAKIRTKESVL